METTETESSLIGLCKEPEPVVLKKFKITSRHWCEHRKREREKEGLVWRERWAFLKGRKRKLCAPAATGLFFFFWVVFVFVAGCEVCATMTGCWNLCVWCLLAGYSSRGSREKKEEVVGFYSLSWVVIFVW